MLPSFAFKLTDLPTLTRSHIILPPFVSKLIFSKTEIAVTFMFAFVVFTENASIISFDILILILRYSADGFVPIKSVQSLLKVNFIINS